MPPKKTDESLPKPKRKRAPKKKVVVRKDQRRRNDTVKNLQPKTSYDQCTEQEKMYLDYLFDPEVKFNSCEAYQRAYGGQSRKACRSNAAVKFRRLKPIIDKMLEEAGLTEQHLKAKLISLLNAKETKFFAHEGVVTDEREVEALSIQMDAVKVAMKSKGMLSEKSTREVDQIDRLIELELEKLAMARQGGPVRETAGTESQDQEATDS